MLIPLVARMQGSPRRAAERYAAWRQAIDRLRDDWIHSSCVELGGLCQYLSDVPADQQPETIVDLIAEHLWLSWSVGKKPLLEDYLPILCEAGIAQASSCQMPADLVEAEFLARHVVPHGDMPSVQHYAARFPARGDIQRMLSLRGIGAGRFVKLARLGQGASSEVWEAFDRAQQTLVALKLPRAECTNRQQWLQSAIREAQLTTVLNHPGIVKLCAPDLPLPEPVFVMRLAKGNSLSDEIRDYHQPSASRTPGDQQPLLERLLHCLVSVCDALDHAHARGIVHCDIKPGNIVIDPTGSGVVLDWGLAQRLVSSNRVVPSEPDGACAKLRESHSPANAAGPVAHVVAGTPDYMAPEQLSGECDARTDVFGLGATLYEILAGRSPHAWSDGLRPADWVRRVRDARFARPRRWNPAAPKLPEAICLKALSRDPGRRQPNAAELAADLRQCLCRMQVAGANSLFRRVWHRLCQRDRASVPRESSA